MLKDLFLNETENAVEYAIKSNKLGQMTEYTKGTLSVEKPKNTDFGDFAINVSSLARSAKIAPPQIANAIVENLSKCGYEVTVVGGFINFKLGKELLVNAIDEIFKKGENYGKPENVKVEKINLEYVSANPTGPFHIGHGRWAAMGSALANVLKFYGHDVYQEFYINDAGSQIQKLGNSLLIRLKQEKGENIDFPEDSPFLDREPVLLISRRHCAWQFLRISLFSSLYLDVLDGICYRICLLSLSFYLLD